MSYYYLNVNLEWVVPWGNFDKGWIVDFEESQLFEILQYHCDNAL